MDFEQPVGNANSVIGVDPDQVSIEGRVMELRQRQVIRLPKLLIPQSMTIVSGIKQSRLGYMGNRAPPSIGREHSISERCLMQPRLDLTEVAARFLGYRNPGCSTPLTSSWMQTSSWGSRSCRMGCR